MKKIFKLNYHSIVDVITNSSSELFVCSDKKVLDFLKSMIGNDIHKDVGFSIQTYKEFCDETGSEIHGTFKDDDEIISINVEHGSDDFESFLRNLNFIEVFD